MDINIYIHWKGHYLSSFSKPISPTASVEHSQLGWFIV